MNPPASSEPRTNAPARVERGTAGRAAFRSWVRWLPRGVAIGIALSVVIVAATHPFLESRARQALAQATLWSTCMLDWSRRREFSWWAYAAYVGVFLAGSLAVSYLLPQ
ncbi:MAG TPA: hypothetical protein VGO40_04665 [Longimicrobium sp.]|jgi:hypothetical protein|nr:hypothetical protein [Longimicrobium sp.]